LSCEGGDILLIGYGNPGRCDDGLGPALAAEVEKLGLERVTTDVDYQLNVEHAPAIAAHATVIFADASLDGAEPFSFRRVFPGEGDRMDFTSHALTQESVLTLARDLFGSRAQAYCLAVRGYEFDAFGEELSARARENLARALSFLEPVLLSGRFSQKENEPCPATSL